MFRVKIALAAAAALLILTLATYFTATARIKRATDESVMAALDRAGRLLEYVSRAETDSYARLAESLILRTNQGQILDAFDPAIAGNLAERNRRAYIAVQVRSQELADESRRPDLVLVMDADGKVLCRDVDPNEMVGEDFKSKYVAVNRALQGMAVKDVWNWQGRMLQVAVAPIRREGRVVGAFAVGFVITAADAQRKKREVLGRDIAYFLDGKVYASSFAGADGKEDPTRVRELGTQIFSGEKWAQRAIDRQKTTDVFPVTLLGDRYVAIAAPMTGNVDNKTAGVVIVSSLAPEQTGIGALILGLGFLGIVIVLVSVMVTARQLIKPAEEIEKGVSEVINGNLEYTFPQVSRDFEGLANALNVMLCRLTGRPEPSEEGEEEGAPQGAAARWRGDPLFVEELGQAEVARVQQAVQQAVAAGVEPAPDADLARLVAEPELVYLQRTFKEYLTARQQQGQSVDNLTLDGFVGKLRQNEDSLKGKYQCRAVRFRVVVKSKQVTLKPVPIY